MDVALRAHEDLPRIAEAGEDAGDVHLPGGHHVAGKVGEGACAEHKSAAADALEIAVGAVGGQRHAAIVRGEGGLAVGGGEFHAAKGH